MMEKFPIRFLVWGMLVSLSAAACPSGWVPAEDDAKKCFFYQSEELNPEEARKGCRALNAELASIESQSQQNTVAKMIRENNPGFIVLIGGKRKAGNKWGWEDRNLDMGFSQWEGEHDDPKFTGVVINAVTNDLPMNWRATIIGEETTSICSKRESGGEETGTGEGRGDEDGQCDSLESTTPKPGVDEDSQCDPLPENPGGGDREDGGDDDDENNGQCGQGGCNNCCNSCGCRSGCCNGCRRNCCN